MAKPSAKVDIVNLGLRNLKQDPVTSIDPPDDDSKAAAAGADWYDQARRATLEAHTWNFAQKRANIGAESAGPLFGYSKKYQLPNDYIRLVRIGEDYNFAEDDYEIEDGFFLCDVEAPLRLVYIYDNVTIGKYPALFVTALAYKLAAFMAYELTGNAAVVTAMEAQFDKAITQAKAVDGQNRPPRRVQRSRLREARMLNGRYRDWQRWGDS